MMGRWMEAFENLFDDVSEVAYGMRLALVLAVCCTVLSSVVFATAYAIHHIVQSLFS